jgi:hypothetical protein
MVREERGRVSLQRQRGQRVVELVAEELVEGCAVSLPSLPYYWVDNQDGYVMKMGI